MKILVTGLNHKSAPINIREKLAFNTKETAKALELLRSKFCEAEFLLLSTCNRVEIYCCCKVDGELNGKELMAHLAEFKGAAFTEIKDYLYTYTNETAVKHLLKVTSSLDSMVVGEAQIIGQVKDSYRLACDVQSTGKVLNRLFHYAFATAKKVHSTTALSNGRVSVAGVAVELAMQLFADISSAKVVVIGAGQIGELLVQHLLHVGSRNITVINRSYERAMSMAESYAIKAEKWENLDRELVTAGIAIASTSGQGYLFTKSSLKKIINNRKKETLLIIDIAVPRNFEPAVSDIEDVHLCSIDDLCSVVEHNLNGRQEDMDKAMEIVCEKASDFMDWFKARDIGPLIGQMKEIFLQIGKKELGQFFKGQGEDLYRKEAMEAMITRIVNKLVHCVIEDVDAVAQQDGPAEAARLIDDILRHAEAISAKASSKEDEQL